MRIKGIIFKTLIATAVAVLSSCVHEFAVIDHSFEFSAEVIYDDKADVHRLTLTRKLGAEDNQYNIAFTMDGESTLTLEDMDGRTHEGSMSETFSDVSARTYTMSRVAPGEHTISLEISTEQFSQSLEVTYTVEDFSFRFEGMVSYNELERNHTLHLTLKEGSESDRYRITYSIDEFKDELSHEDIFTKDTPRKYDLPQVKHGDHTLNLKISTSKHSQELRLPFNTPQEIFFFDCKVIYDEENDKHYLSLNLSEGRTDRRYKIGYKVDTDSPVNAEDMFTIESARLYTLPEKDPGEHKVHVEISNDEYVQTVDLPYTVLEQTFRFASSILFDEQTKTHSLRIELKEGRDDVRYTVSYTIDNQEPRKVFDEMFLDDKVRVYDLPAKAPGQHTVNLKITTSKSSQSTDVAYTVKDYSFKVNADIEYDSNNLSHVLFLTLLSGSRDEKYTISYTVDGGHSVKLINTSGKELPASFSESFQDVTVQSYDLSRASIGKHTMKLDISTKDYSQTLEISYEVVAIPFSIHSEINTTEGASTKMLLSLKSGDNAVTYNVSILYDGKAINGYDNAKVNFSSTPIKTLTLPLLRPGKHDVTVKVTDGYTTQTNKMNYNEPLRHPYIDITLRHNDANGRHEAVIGDNPYGIELTLKTFLTLTGKCTYCTSTYEYYYTDIMYSTKTKLLSDSSTSTKGYDDTTVNLIDRDALATKMTSSYEMSNKVEYFYDPGAGGEDSGREWWQKTGTERAYYTITKEELKIDISGEKVTGVTLRVKNQIGTMSLNGKTNSSGTTNISL